MLLHCLGQRRREGRSIAFDKEERREGEAFCVARVGNILNMKTQNENTEQNPFEF